MAEAEEAAAHHLLTVLEERDLNVDLDKILAVFESDDTKAQAAAWVNEYLNDETLLTKEELDLYQALKTKGVLHHYENDEDPVRPILDRELTSAIVSLQNSTAAIEEQSKVLEAQRDALMALKALDKPNLSAEHMRNERRRREAQEKARLDVSVEDVSTSITEQLADAQRDIEAETTALKSYVTERLSSDDKMLAALPNIVTKLAAEPEPSTDEKSIEQWCRALISYRTAEIKSKVETTYLRNLANPSTGGLQRMPEAELKAQKEELKNELDTLHSEITAVNEMVVEHDFRKPIAELIQRKERQRAQARCAWFEYVSSTLEYMTKRLQLVDDRAKQANDLRLALEHINRAASEKIEDASAKSLESPRKRAPSAVKSLFPHVALKPSMKLKIPPAVEEALRHAGISFNNQSSAETLQETLAKVQLEREKNLSDHYSSAASTTQETLADVVGKADFGLMAVMDALFSYTPFQTVHLTSQDLERSMAGRELELEEADQNLLVAETNELSLSDPRVKAFISRWGGDR